MTEIHVRIAIPVLQKIVLPFLVLGLAPWSRSSSVTSRLAKSHECMRAVQPELSTVLGSKPDTIGQREREREQQMHV
jgi:hypothetical protein